LKETACFQGTRQGLSQHYNTAKFIVAGEIYLPMIEFMVACITLNWRRTDEFFFFKYPGTKDTGILRSLVREKAGWQAAV
jgi:hypothetical protein